jgi:hypothetical protein
MDVHRPGISQVLAGFALVATLAATGCSDNPTPTPENPPASSAPAPSEGAPTSANSSRKPMLEDPNAAVVAADFKRFGDICSLVKSGPIAAQGVKQLFECNKHSFEVVEIRGKEASDGWKKIKNSRNYKPAPAIAQNAGLAPHEGVAVYADNGEDATFVHVFMYGGVAPVNDDDLTELGKHIAGRIKA